jgi:hypothetical protein
LGKTAERQRGKDYLTLQLRSRGRDASWGIKWRAGSKLRPLGARRVGASRGAPERERFTTFLPGSRAQKLNALTYGRTLAKKEQRRHAAERPELGGSGAHLLVAAAR